MSVGFIRHYHKHPETCDRDCWRELAPPPPPGNAPISKERYAHEAFRTYQSAWLEFEGADWSPDRGEFHEKRVTRFDLRQVRVVASTCRTKMVTCYHLHHKGHATPPTGTRRLEEAHKLLDWLDKRISGDQMRPTAITPLRENLRAILKVATSDEKKLEALMVQVKTVAGKAKMKRDRAGNW